MNCELARQLLDSCRPGGDDLLSPELSPTAAHLQVCAECLNHFRGLQQLDGRLGAVMRNVPIPADLCDRIHTRLQRVRTRRRLRQWGVWTVGTVAAIMLCALFLRPTALRPTIELDLRNFGEQAISADSDLDLLRELPPSLTDRSSIEDWCATQLRELQLRYAELPAWPQFGMVALGRTTIEGVAVAVFRYRDSRGECDVLALPHRQWIVVNLDAGPQLVHRTRNLVVIAWKEENVAYVAVLKNWAPEQWRRLLEPSPGIT